MATYGFERMHYPTPMGGAYSMGPANKHLVLLSYGAYVGHVKGGIQHRQAGAASDLTIWSWHTVP